MVKVGLMVLKNGVSLGYPFVESITSVLGALDVMFVIDFGSTDGTMDVLGHMRVLSKKIELEQHEWPKNSSGGSAIAVATNIGMDICGKRWPGCKVFYLQADEVYHEKAHDNIVDYLASNGSTSFRFMHFRNGFDRIIENPTYNRAIRITFSASRSIRDGFNFRCKGVVRYSDHVVYHVGWCFPENICKKHVNHASLYPGNPGYARAKRICAEMLKGKVSRDRLCKEVDSNYRFNNFNVAGLPSVLKHLLKCDFYNPDLSLSVLNSRIKGA
jgi:hypothetical protein